MSSRFCSSPHFHWQSLKSAQGCFVHLPVCVFLQRGSLQTEKYHKHQPGTAKSQTPTWILPKRQRAALGEITSPPCRLSICSSLIKWDYNTAPSQRAGKTLKVKIVLQAWYIIITQQKPFQASFLFYSVRSSHISKWKLWTGFSICADFFQQAAD